MRGGCEGTLAIRNVWAPEFCVDEMENCYVDRSFEQISQRCRKRWTAIRILLLVQGMIRAGSMLVPGEAEPRDGTDVDAYGKEQSIRICEWQSGQS